MHLNMMLKSAKLFHLGFLQDELCRDFAGRYYAWNSNSKCSNGTAQPKHHNESAVIVKCGIQSFLKFTHI